jgi:hypothetical protein
MVVYSQGEIQRFSNEREEIHHKNRKKTKSTEEKVPFVSFVIL